MEVSVGPWSAREHARRIACVAAQIPRAVQSNHPEKEQRSHQHVTKPRRKMRQARISTGSTPRNGSLHGGEQAGLLSSRDQEQPSCALLPTSVQPVGMPRVFPPPRGCAFPG